MDVMSYGANRHSRSLAVGDPLISTGAGGKNHNFKLDFQYYSQ